MKKEVKDDPKQVRVEDVIREETGEVQPIEVKIAEKKKQKISASYTLRSFAENVRKLNELGLLEEDKQEAEAMAERAMQRWIKNGMR